MRILFVSPRQCFPLLSGAKLRDYHFARGLGIRSELTYVYFGEPGAAALSKADLPFCDRIVRVPQPRMYTPSKLVRGVLGRLPLPLVNYTSAGMSSALREILAADRYDLVHLDSIHMMPYESLFRGLPVTYNWHNIESEAMRRYVDTAPSPGRRAVASLTISKFETAERHILRRAFGHIVCSDRERDELLKIDGGARVAVVQNGVDLGAPRMKACDEARFRLVFVGSMSYHANIDAALKFAKEVWPGIRDRHPEWRLTIVGSNPPQSLLAQNEQPGIDVTGTVPDVRPFYEEALAAIVPLRTGGGTRLKILEAMAASVPVVSTEIGAEGLPVTPGRDILIARDASGWLPALESLEVHRPLRAAVIGAARLTVADFDWEKLGELLYSTYADWLKSAGSGPGKER